MTETSGRETGEGLTSTTDWHKIDAACVEQTKIAKVQYGKSEWQTSPPRQLEARLLAVFSLPYFFIEREKKKNQRLALVTDGQKNAFEFIWFALIQPWLPVLTVCFRNVCSHSPLFFIQKHVCNKIESKQWKILNVSELGQEATWWMSALSKTKNTYNKYIWTTSHGVTTGPWYQVQWQEMFSFNRQQVNLLNWVLCVMSLIHLREQVFTSVQLSNLIKNTSCYDTESFLTKGTYSIKHILHYSSFKTWQFGCLIFILDYFIHTVLSFKTSPR